MIQATLHHAELPVRVVYVVEDHDRKVYRIVKFVDLGYEHLTGAMFDTVKTYKQDYGFVHRQPRPTNYWLCI